ncbi:hypothetical protein C900_01984 [Fulvivirga imtechensis AK7]|uniref:Bacteroidetes-specific membrane protein n=1 Tax=Fulvivirga imtechensis AK7 TaxID=1237149 RepID=L8JWJ3_9BACT|nr:PorP/SprF family type IX secretion system membrane protein [Fulvivirga imtechensis]ELR71989.1 hypothetical protein C900_01984 [Fulvivirga imtechensis AK7]
MKGYIKLIALLCLLILICFEGMAQRQTFTQYYLNLPAINAGFTGFEPFLDMKTAYRQRWNNFSEKNNSFYISAYGSLGSTSPTVFRNNALRVSNPSTYGRLARNKNLKRKHGLGGMVMSQTVGPFKSLETSANYAYHLPITGLTSLSFGTRISYNNYEIDFSVFDVREHPDVVYDELLEAGGKQQQFVGDFGIVLYTSRFFFGLSSSNLVASSFGSGRLLELPSDLSLEFLAGSQFELSPYVELYPGIRMRHSEIYGLSWEVNARLRYNKLIYLGAVYQNDVKASLLFGLTFDSRYNINYSYDYYLNDLREFSTGNHEFTLGIAIFNKYSTEPRLW